MYLAQNRRHPLYGSQGRSNLEKSLRLLHEHYNRVRRHDVLIFHEGDFDEADQASVISSALASDDEAIASQLVQFRLLPPSLWAAPPHVDASRAAEWHNPKFGLGYRHMCRLFAFLIHPYLLGLGYDYAMRLDDDSYILSPIHYNVFERMRRRRWRYVYRTMQFEARANALAFPEAVASFLAATSTAGREDDEKTLGAATSFVRHCRPTGRLDACVTGKRNQTHPHLSQGWDGFSFYNNFYATELRWWGRPEVRRFLSHLDGMGGTHYYRWGDALIHTAAAQLYLKASEVGQVDEWTYEHASVAKKDGVVLWGGIFPGSDDERAAERVDEFRSRHHGVRLAPFYWQVALDRMAKAPPI